MFLANLMSSSSANAMRSAVLGSAPIPSIKAMIADQMDDPGWRTMRPPWVTLDDTQAAAVVANVRAQEAAPAG